MSKLLYTIFLLSFPIYSSAKIFVNIGSANVKKSQLAIVPFFPQEGTSANLELEEQLNSRLKRNIQFSSYFEVIPAKTFIRDPKTLSPLPYPTDLKGFHWSNWKLIGADFLIFHRYLIVKNQIHITSFFYNVNSQKTLFKETSQANKNQVSRLIDQLSNKIVEQLSGRKGIFETQITSVRNISKTKKEIFLMDWNGENKRRVSFHRSIALSPIWSPSGQEILYTAFVYNKKRKMRQAVLFSYDKKNNKIRLISDKKGANLGAGFLPNGKELLVTLNIGSSLMDIFKLNLKSNRLTPLTSGPRGAIHVEPDIHVKTKKVAFSSNQKGKVHIYTMDLNGKNLKQLTFAGHYNSTPSWSPVKNELVFSGKSKGRFDIFLIRASGTGLKRLTQLRKKQGTWANSESPSFSPDGRFIVFSSDVSGNYQLYVMNLDNQHIERITFDNYNYKSPKWSPYLKN